MVLNATASVPTSSFVVTGASRSRSPAATACAVFVIASIGRAILRARKVRPDGQQARHQETDAAERKGQRPRRGEGRVLALLRHEARPDLVEPAVDPDHRHAAIVAVETTPRLPGDRCADPLRRNAVRVPRVEARVHEVPVGPDEIRLAGLAETRRREDDPVEALEIETGGDDPDALAAAVEERGRDRDRGLARERGDVDGLHIGSRAAACEPRLLRLVALLMLRHRRHDDVALEVEHEEFLRIRGLRDDIRQCRLDTRVRRATLLRGGPTREDGRRRATEPTCVARVEAAEQPADEHDVAPLLVDPPVERAGLELLGRVESVEDLGLERRTRAHVRDDADDSDHHERQDEECGNEPGHQAPAPAARPALSHCTVWPMVDRSNCPAFVA